MNEEQKRLFGLCRRTALERLKDPAFRKRATPSQQERILRFLDDCPDWGVISQVERDLRVYLLYDCLAMWLDAGGGLCKYYPTGFLGIASLFFKKRDLTDYFDTPKEYRK